MAMNVGVRVHDDEPFEHALRRFRKACDKTGLIGEMKRRKYFVSKSELRRKKHLKVMRRMMKERGLLRPKKRPKERPLIATISAFDTRPWWDKGY